MDESQSHITGYSCAPQQEDITIVETLSQGKRFRIVKARMGDRFVILKSVCGCDSMALALLRREYEISSPLKHPNVVSTISFADNTPVAQAIIYEYVAGPTLEEFIASEPPYSERQSVLNGIIDGVEYLHKMGILHNDLKPQNIIVNLKGTAKIIDFGLSDSEDRVFPGAIGGSDGYTAPEILNGTSEAIAASDIYSLGKITSFIFDGKRYRRLCRKCMNMNISKRPQNIAEFRRTMLRSRYTPIIATVATMMLCAISALAGTAHRQACINDGVDKEMSIFFNKALKDARKQRYRETAQIIFNLYLADNFHYIDSLQRLYPAHSDGSLSVQVSKACDVHTMHVEILQRVIDSLPSMSALPAEEQTSLLERFSKEYLGQE